MSLVSLFIERGRRHEEVERDSFLERKPENEVLEEFRMSNKKFMLFAMLCEQTCNL